MKKINNQIVELTREELVSLSSEQAVSDFERYFNNSYNGNAKYYDAKNAAWKEIIKGIYSIATPYEASEIIFHLENTLNIDEDCRVFLLDFIEDCLH